MKRTGTLLIVLTLTLASFTAGAGTLRGDVDQDGSVNINDVTALINYLLSGNASGINIVNADSDQDGKVNIDDVTALIDRLLKGEWPEEEQNHDYVDLGLPSGTLWATCNVGASSPEGYGDYFAWGETETKEVYSWSTYKWSNGARDSLTKYCFDSSFGYNGFVDYIPELDSEDDAAAVNWGSSWCLPTREQIEELKARCSWHWTMRNGVNGQLVTGPNGNSLFLPAAGGSLGSAGSDGCYWSSTLFRVSYDAVSLSFNSEGINCDFDYRIRGKVVRAVRVKDVPYHDESDCVDLGLPSGTLWATCNVGAGCPEGYGDYFAWGEISPKGIYRSWGNYKWCNGSGTSLSKYCTNSEFGTVDHKTELDLEDDAAYVNWGPLWRMPTKDQQDELREKCSWQWEQLNGVTGYIVTGLNGKTIFLPAAGFYDIDGGYGIGSNGGYWACVLDPDMSSYACTLIFNSGYIYNWNYYRYRGRSVRAVRASRN